MARARKKVSFGRVIDLTVVKLKDKYYISLVYMLFLQWGVHGILTREADINVADC
jgi:hypothetical protein